MEVAHKPFRFWPIRDAPSAAHRAAAIEGTADTAPADRALQRRLRGLRYGRSAPGTKAGALVAGIPRRKPARCAAASAASTTRRLPSQPTRTSGASAGGAALPNFLLTRSVDQVGRKSETTRRIASLHFEIGTLSGTATDQLKPPSARPTPGTGNGVDGRALTRTRVPACCALPSRT
jgi:hypothetical protein